MNKPIEKMPIKKPMGNNGTLKGKPTIQMTKGGQKPTKGKIGGSK